MSQQVLQDAKRAANWQSIRPDSLRKIRTMLILKYGTLTEAGHRLQVPYPRIGGALSGRESIVWVIRTIQDDLNLSNDQVLNLWPLLKEWPKEGRAA